MKAFNYFVVGSGVTDKTQKRALLLHLVGPEVQEIFETLDETGADNDFDTAVSKLEGYFKPKTNVSFERHKFSSEGQKANETVQEFTTRLKHLSLSCEFNDSNDRIRDQVVQKCTSTTLRRKFLTEKDLTLEKVLDIASTFERAQNSATQMENGVNGQVPEAGSTFQVRRPERRRDDHRGQGAQPCAHIECYSCGRKGHRSKDPTCPAKSAKCHKCQNKGHFAVKCKSTPKFTSKSKKPNRYARSISKYTEPDDETYIFTVKDSFSANRLIVNVGGVPLDMIIDSGATCNVIDKNTWAFLKAQKLFKCISHARTDKTLFAYGSKTPLKLAGTFRANIEGNGVTSANVEFTVLDGKGQSLLGRDSAIALDVLRVGPQICNLSTDIENSYPELFSGVGKLKDFQLTIPIDESVDPVIQPIRRVPYHLRERLEKKLESLEQTDIIEKVDTPSRWVSPAVIVPKGEDDIRLCIDMRQANTAVRRVHHTIPTIEDVLQEMNGSKIFSKLDIKNAYHQIELDEKSREITTFVTHTGQFRYKRLMFGVSCASELYQKVLQQILQNCPNAQNIMDDIIVHGVTQEQHDECLKNVLNVLREKGLTLNREKCEFNMSEIVFMGNVVSEHGVGPTESKVQDVLDARTPQNASEVRSFLGLVNFNARYIPDLATISEPLRRLTRKNVKFHWELEQEKSFEELKRRLTSAETLGFYDRNAKTQVICDASPVGIAAVLLQEQGDEQRVICYASRSLSKAEQKLAQIEREALAIVWGVERFHVYLYGTEFELLTDCKPLQFIMSPRSKPSARIERWVLRLQSYKFATRHIKGLDNISDCLSRLLKKSKQDDQETNAFISSTEYVKFVAVNATPSAITTREIEKASRFDTEISAVRECIAHNLWHKLPYKQYLPIKNELSAIGFLLLRGTRIVVPEALREQILEIAHESHPGIVSMKQNLRQHVYWPNIDKDVEKHCKTCYGCQLVSMPSKPEEMTRTELPNAPWQFLAIDWLGPLDSKDYILVTVDYYSRYIELGISKSPTSESAMKILHGIFSRHGLPLSVQTDGASCFTSDVFKAFLAENGIKHRRTTPFWPAANGECERQNRSLLKRIKIAQAEKRSWKAELDKYLLAYRSTPHSTTGVSPAELLFGRKIRSKLPSLQNHRLESEVRDTDSERKEKGKQYADKKRGACESSINVGDKVLLKQQKRNKLDTNFDPDPFVVCEKNGNSVVVERNGVTYKRNVSFVKKFSQRDNETLNQKDGDRSKPTEPMRKVRHSLRNIKVPRRYDDFDPK